MVLLLLPALHAQSQKRKSTPSRSAKKPAASGKKKKAAAKPATSAQARKLKRAFVASADLKPMARQLLENRSPAAYAAIEKYARVHAKDDGGPLAQLVLGYARVQDREYDGAIANFKKAHSTGGELNDYADFFLAGAYEGKNDTQSVLGTLKSFDESYPRSVLAHEAEMAQVRAWMQLQQPDAAARLLEAIRQPVHADVELALGRAYVALGEKAKAANIFNRIYCEMPLSGEAYAASLELKKLDSTGFVAAPTLEQRRARAELLMKGRRFAEAATEYQGLWNSIRSDLSRAGDQRELQIKYAGALYRDRKQRDAKRLLEDVPVANDLAEPERLYYLHEIARDEDNGERERAIAHDMVARFPESPWLQEALLSAGNMYLLRRDYGFAIEFFADQARLFPKGKYSPYSHWKAAWLTLRTGNNGEAKRLFEEQIRLYPTGTEIPAALYWRARLAEEDKDWSKAGNYYATIIQRFPHYYYADLARLRLRFRFSAGERDPLLDGIPSAPALASRLMQTPTDDERFARSRLLGNAALFDFAIRELQAAGEGGNAAWPQAEIANIYLDEDRPQRALQTLKKALPGYFAADIEALPRKYWQVLFPRPYWDDLARNSGANGLDPYLVASLIRQESEFNAAAVSRANAWGLMQLLPSVGKSLARQMRVRHFTTDSLTDPKVNLMLGTRYFRSKVDEFGGQVEYALAAYNAGSDRVKAWRAAEQYRDVYEFVESIPFTETREYVQSIMRNMTIYKLLYSAPAGSAVAQAGTP